MRQAFWWILCLIGYVQSGAAGDAMDMSKLQGRWVLELINGQPVSSGAELYFEIERG